MSKRKEPKAPPAPKQRNPLAVLAYFKTGAGIHGKSKKAQRQADRIALAKNKGDYHVGAFA